MKQLILFRHAKSSWKDERLADVERPLAERGLRDAPRMGQRLCARGARPGLVLTSHAARARATAELLAAALSFPLERVRVDEDLYLASPDEVLGVVATQDDGVDCLLVVGHNPGLTELANRLVPDLQLDNLPTSGVVAIDSAAALWADVGRAHAKLAYYDYPKNPELALTEN